MAIYHFSAQVASRSAGRSAVAMAAYRSGERLVDERTGETKSYRRSEKPHAEILAPAHAPDWIRDRGRLWNEVEISEKRKDAQLCREINLALPKEFSPKLQEQLLRAYIEREFVAKGMVADMAIHRNDANNPHAHIMLTLREITSEGFGKKVREWNDRGLLENWREAWAHDVNRVFERANRPERIDHRSLEKQGVTDRLPTIHEGPVVREMEARGVQTDRGQINREVKAHNQLVIDLQAYAKEKAKLQVELSQQPAKTPKEINEEHSRLYWERNGMRAEIHQLEAKLNRIGEIRKLAKECESLREQQAQLRPQGVWQRMRKNNQPEIDSLEREIQLKEQSMERLQKNTLPASEASGIEQKLSVLRGTLSAVERAFKAVEQERNRMLQEQQIQQMRQRAKYQQQSRDHDRER